MVNRFDVESTASGYKSGFPFSQAEFIDSRHETRNPNKLFFLASFWDIVETLKQQSGQEVEVSHPFLTDVQRIFIATTSVEKLDTFKKFFHLHKLTYIANQLIPIRKAICPGKEPEDPQALLVAANKILRALSSLLNYESGENELNEDEFVTRHGGKAAGFASDTTVSVKKLDSTEQPIHLLNMSRYLDTKGNVIDVPERTRTLQELYSTGTTLITYHVAAVGSVQNVQGKNILVGTGVQIELEVGPIPKEVVSNIYRTQIRVSHKSNVGLPLVDTDSPLLEYIRSVQVSPLANLTARQSNGEVSGTIQPHFQDEEQVKKILLSSLSKEEKLLVFQSLHDWIIGGMPPNFEAILRVDPNSSLFNKLNDGEMLIV